MAASRPLSVAIAAGILVALAAFFLGAAALQVTHLVTGRAGASLLTAAVALLLGYALLAVALGVWRMAPRARAGACWACAAVFAVALLRTVALKWGDFGGYGFGDWAGFAMSIGTVALLILSPAYILSRPGNVAAFARR